ncbi:DUF58 domain-containing protein [Massilia yuzhufengensis]|uniref:DUF58 domain-containing protein n=1 Tax=Massilia yuzhufengensis TaxID=1164594 RepID=A0A1I1WFT0_9BURK|nr:DUF58 domain-containing protein [Massilia yuzhufengensis]SFD93997.1 Protein of unknown function DUF58 [Massilia yuzhufengensis]
MSLAKTALIAHTHNLDLVIRHVLAGLGHGIHAGRERGAGVEFSEYRAYAPGDEWRRVDWKLLARADRYFVREAERDSHVAVWLVLDASASMLEPSREVDGVDKLAYARTLLGCVAAIAQRQGDAFGLVILGGGKVQFTPALRGPRQLQRVLLQLSRAQADGALPDADTLRASLHFAQFPSVIFAASDLLDWPSPLSQALTRLRGMRHDVRVLCLQTQAEVDASFSSTPAYRDPEQGAGVVRFGADLADGYRRNRDEHFTQVKAQCRKSDIPLVAARIEQPPGEVLRLWLHRPGSRP